MAKHALTELISTLNKEEIRYLKIYINRIQYKEKDSKLIVLFDLLKQESYSEYDEKLVYLLYGKKNKNAFARLKNRLTEEIEQSLLMLNRTKDERLAINNLISLAQIFIYKSIYSKALTYLLKAEKLAIKQEHYDLLNVIYDQIVKLSSLYRKIKPAIYIEKGNANNAYYQQLKQLNSVMATINHELFDTNFSGKNTLVIDKLNQIVADLDVSYLQSPKIQFKIHTCVREVLLQKKDFNALENYLIYSLADFETKKLLNKNTHAEKIVLICWIINTLTKNKKFKLSTNYTKQLHEALMDYNKLHFNKYEWTYYQSLLINYSFLGETKKIINLLNELLTQKKTREIPAYSVFIYINLAATYYCDNKINKALDVLSNIISTDIYKPLNNSWKLNILLLEIMFRLENEDFNFVVYRINNLKRSFQKELKKEQYKREKEFIGLLSNIAQLPDVFKNARFLKKANLFIKNSPKFEPGSNEIINYKLWLNAKIKKTNYYDLVLKEANM